LKAISAEPYETDSPAEQDKNIDGPPFAGLWGSKPRNPNKRRVDFVKIILKQLQFYET
jgi:hypothetical protein